jgi:hypothetical protein
VTTDSWIKIAGSILAAAVLGLQGLNLSEVTNGNHAGQKRADLLEQILQLSKDMKQSLDNQTKILENGTKLLEGDDKSFKQQGEILNTLQKAIEQRDRLLRESLEKKSENQ